jgi:acyl carrier protein
MSAIEEIHARVAQVLVEVLNADEDDVTPGAKLQGDLGAESIDFMDIMFRLEREFDIRVQEDELFPDSILKDEPAFVQDGRVTDQGLAELRSRLPHSDLSGFERDRRLSAVPDLFTVGLVSRYVAWELGRGAEAGRDVPGSVGGHRQFLSQKPRLEFE